jgi:hypothetical protein
MALKLKTPKKNYIPDMTHPYGKAWDQPSKSQVKAIVIDDTHAMMDRKTFDKLLNYSHSVPSAAYEGKMWKGEYYDDKNRPTGKYYLRWYGLHKEPNMLSNHMRDIIIVD